MGKHLSSTGLPYPQLCAGADALCMHGCAQSARLDPKLAPFVRLVLQGEGDDGFPVDELAGRLEGPLEDGGETGVGVATHAQGGADDNGNLVSIRAASAAVQASTVGHAETQAVAFVAAQQCLLTGATSVLMCVLIHHFVR